MILAFMWRFQRWTESTDLLAEVGEVGRVDVAEISKILESLRAETGAEWLSVAKQ